MKKRRSGFILLEVFLVIALLSLAILPISSYPYKIFEKEKKELLSIELKRMETLVFAEFVRDLPDHICWSHIEQGDISLNLGTQTVDLGKLGTFSYDAKINITTQRQKKSFCLLACEVCLVPKNPKHLSPEPRIHYLFVNNK